MHPVPIRPDTCRDGTYQDGTDVECTFCLRCEKYDLFALMIQRVEGLQQLRVLRLSAEVTRVHQWFSKAERSVPE